MLLLTHRRNRAWRKLAILLAGITDPVLLEQCLFASHVNAACGGFEAARRSDRPRERAMNELRDEAAGRALQTVESLLAERRAMRTQAWHDTA